MLGTEHAYVRSGKHGLNVPLGALLFKSQSQIAIKLKLELELVVFERIFVSKAGSTQIVALTEAMLRPFGPVHSA